MNYRLDNKKIRQLRENIGVGITEFGETVDVSPRMIIRMENDQGYNPGVLTLIKVSEYHNVMIDDLVIKC